jgi:DedD protein
MARPISDEELQLKKRARRRLVGAIVLVTAIAVVLPMILDSEPQPSSQNVEIQIPSPNAGEFKPKSAAAQPEADKSAKAAPEGEKHGGSALPEPVSPIGEPTSPSSDEKLAMAKPAAVEKSRSSPDAGSKERAEKPSPSKDTAPKSSADGAYVVQVAALSDAAKAKQLQKRMAGTGLKTYTEVVTTASGRVTRVRAGPYSSREAAEKARTQLKKAGFDGQVMAK